MNLTTVPHWFAALTPPGRSPSSEADRNSDRQLARVPVLVIEDEVMIAWMLESLLQDIGFEAITLTSNAAEAIAAAKRETPELIISDINLDFGADGIEAVGVIRRTCSPAVVFVSAYVDESAQNRISQEITGARILPKPLSGDCLSTTIREVLQIKRASS